MRGVESLSADPLIQGFVEAQVLESAQSRVDDICSDFEFRKWMYSDSEYRAQPSTISEAIETAARRSCEFIPKSSSRGKEAVSLVGADCKLIGKFKCW